MARAQRKQASSFFHSIPFYGMVVLISGKHKQEKQQNIYKVTKESIIPKY